MSSLKYVFAFLKVTKISIIFIFVLSEILTSQTDYKFDSLQRLYKCTQNVKTGFTAIDNVQVYIILNWFHFLFKKLKVDI